MFVFKLHYLSSLSLSDVNITVFVLVEWRKQRGLPFPLTMCLSLKSDASYSYYFNALRFQTPFTSNRLAFFSQTKKVILDEFKSYLQTAFSLILFQRNAMYYNTQHLLCW